MEETHILKTAGKDHFSTKGEKEKKQNIKLVLCTTNNESKDCSFFQKFISETVIHIIQEITLW